MSSTTDAGRRADEVSVRALSNAPDAQNRRVYSRFAVELDVSMSSDHNFYAGFTENMSAGGIFVATHGLKAVGSMVDLCIFMPGSEVAIRGKGQVRWVRAYNEQSNVPPGMGITFVELEPGAERAIEAFLAQREPLFYDE